MSKKRKLICFLTGLSLSLASASLAGCSFGLPNPFNSGNSASESVSESSNEESSSSSVVDEESSSNGGGNSSVEEASLTISGSGSMTEFETTKLTAKLTGSTATIAWSSSDETIATVDQNGTVTALKAGKVTLTARAGDLTATHSIEIAKTNIVHRLAFSVGTATLFEGETDNTVSVSVLYGEETLDNEKYGIRYTWSYKEGDAAAVELTPSADGSSVTLTGKKAGNVTYTVVTTARGYEVHEDFTIVVKEEVVSLTFANTAMQVGDGEYFANLTFGSTETENLTIGDVLLEKNGVPTETKLTVAWTMENENILSLSDGKLSALKAGSVLLTGTATHEGETLEIKLRVTVSRAQVALEETLRFETESAQLTLPEAIEGTVEKVTVNTDNVIYDAAEGHGSLNEKTLTAYAAGLPAKMSDLGKGQTLTVQTEKTVYTLSADVYTMIIDNKEELDKWQEIAAENAIRAGICIEQQKGFAYSGYFLLNADIDYNGVWKPYKTYGEISKLSPQDNKQLDLNGLEGVIDESWTRGINGGFQGIFDGCGHNIDGLQTTGPYGGFIVVNGKNGVVQNLSFTNAEIGIASSLVVERGQGTVRDVYMQIKKFSSEVYVTPKGNGEVNREGAVTFFKSGNAPVRTVERVLIDVTDCGLTDLEEGYLGSCCNANAYQGIYIIGAAETLSDRIFDELPKTATGDTFATLADLLADEAHGAVVKMWNTEFWEIGEKYILPKSIVNDYKGDISFVETEEEVNCGTEVVLKTNKDAKYIVYSLAEEVEGVTLVGNRVTLADTATVGSTVTIVATSIIDGKTAEYTFTIAAFAQTYAVNAPAENDYYTFDGKERATEGKAYTFTLTATYANCKDFVVFVNDEEIAAVDGAYTVANVTGELTIKVLHGYIEHGANVTVTYNDDGSIKLENAVQNWNFAGDDDAATKNTNNAPYFAWISAEYIQYMIDQGYKTVNFTACADNAIAAQAIANYNGKNFMTLTDGSTKGFTQTLDECTANMYFWVQNSGGSGNAIKDQGGYMTIWGLQFLKEAVAVTIPEDSMYYTFTGASSVEKGGDYTFKLTFTDDVESSIVSINGTEVTLAGDGSYTVTNVTEALTITVEVTTKAAAACAVVAPATSSYYTFNGAETVQKGEAYTFTLTATVANCNEFIVFANGEEITAVDGTYTVENVQDTLTIKVIHGYIEHGANVTVTYSDDGSIKVENAKYCKQTEGSENAKYQAYISQEYIALMVERGYTNFDITVQLGDFAKANQGCVQYNNAWMAFAGSEAAVSKTNVLSAVADNMWFWMQLDGRGANVVDGAYLTITGLKFSKAKISVTAPEESTYYTFTGENSVEKGGDYTFKLTFTDDVESSIVSINGTEVTLAGDGSYTVTNVTEALTITVEVTTKAAAACAVVAPATSSYYTFNGAETVQKGEAYTFTLTATVANCNEFIVFANGEEITAVDGTYTVENVQDTLTIKVLHGYIEHGANVTVTYNDDGSIKVENAVFGIIDDDWKKPYEAFISADYINYMIGKGYTYFNATVVPDGTIAAQAFIKYNGSNIISYQKETDANSCIKDLGVSAADNMYIWVQNSGNSGNGMKDQGGYMTITGLTFSKGQIAVTAPAESSYYTFNGAETVKNGENYTFTLTATYENCNEFIVFANDEEITAVDGVYTVENVTGELTIKVLHGYIECGSNITVTYNSDGSIKFEKKDAGLNVNDTNNFGWISKDYINYMISQGYKTISLTVTLSDATKANCGMIKDKPLGNATIDLSLWQEDNTYEQTQNTKTVSLTELTEDLKFWLQHNGSHWKVQDGGYMTITGLTFSK